MKEITWQEQIVSISWAEDHNKIVFETKKKKTEDTLIIDHEEICPVEWLRVMHDEKLYEKISILRPLTRRTLSVYFSTFTI